MSKSILLADDSATIRKVVELTFGGTDYHVESVSNGTEALERLEVLRPDVVLADVVMPEPTGYEICRRIKSSDRPVPVLLLAGTFEAFDHDEARACGADGCLLKPFEGRTLVDRVASLLADREAVSRASVEPVEPVESAQPLPPVSEPAGPEAPVDAPDALEPPGRPAATAAVPFELPPSTIEAIAEAAVRRISDEVVREIAREVVPRIAETVVRQRISELESEDD